MAMEFLHELDVPFFKVASCDANNFPYLEKTAKKGRLLSTKLNGTKGCFPLPAGTVSI